MRRLGLALSSGGARGVAHVGVLKALEDAKIPVHAIVGASVGAQVGGLYAAGVSLGDIEAMWGRMGAAHVARGLLPTFPYRGWSSGEAVARLIRERVGEHRVEACGIKFVAVATSLRTGETVVLDRGLLVDVVRASTSIPGLFTPVELNGQLLVDGGLSSPLPADIARNLESDVVLAVDALADPSERNLHRTHVFSILAQMSTIFQKRIAELELKVEPPDLLVRPQFDGRPPTYADVGDAAEAGYRAAVQAIPELRSLLGL